MTKNYEFLLTEKEKWAKRRNDLEKEIAELDMEEKRLVSELAKIRGQVSYYETLTRDMKRELQPPDVVGILKTL